MEPFWKAVDILIDKRIKIIRFHDSIHGFLGGRGTGTEIIEAKLAQQLAYIKQAPFYEIFLDLRKAFNAMDMNRCLLILKCYGVEPNIPRLVKLF